MEKIDNSAALEAIAKHRERKERVVFTNGCFDILHVGHVRYLQRARELGEVLVIGLNSDESVKRLKGRSRPILPLDERRELLLALRAVDYVCVFAEDTPFEIIAQVRPDVLVKGGDWPVEKIVGHDYVASYGGKTYSLPYIEGRSTTEIIAQILKTGLP